METLYIKIVDPKVKQILEALADLNLIYIEKMPDVKEETGELDSNAGSSSNSAPSLDEITREAENVKDPRYTDKTKE